MKKVIYLIVAVLIAMWFLSSKGIISINGSRAKQYTAQLLQKGATATAAAVKKNGPVVKKAIQAEIEKQATNKPVPTK